VFSFFFDIECYSNLLLTSTTFAIKSVSPIFFIECAVGSLQNVSPFRTLTIFSLPSGLNTVKTASSRQKITPLRIWVWNTSVDPAGSL